MISYLIEAVLFIALVVTTWRVTKMHRELKKLRQYGGEFGRMTAQMTVAFDKISATVHDLSANGTELVRQLGVKIDEARELTTEIDRRRGDRILRMPDAGVRNNADRAHVPLVTVRQSNN